jgi:Leucine-rich repeat (LRR) protein
MVDKKVQKLVEDAKACNASELYLGQRSITELIQIPTLTSLHNLTRLSLAHNKLKALPPSICNLQCLEYLTVYNNHLEELPQNLNKLNNLVSLNLGMNRLVTLPRNFEFNKLAILDVSYNNLSDNYLPESLYQNKCLRALYMSDNDLEVLPESIGNLSESLEVLALRSNDIYQLPKAIGKLLKLKELNLVNNRLIVLPPELGKLRQFRETARDGQDCSMELDQNKYLVAPLLQQLNHGTSSLLDYLVDKNYMQLYQQHMQFDIRPPEKADKSKKVSRKPIKK